MSARWAGRAVLYVAINAALTLAEQDAAQVQLLQGLEDALEESDARQLLSPYMDKLKTLDSQVIEKLVLKQWWGIARDIVAQSHTQQVDLSVSVRNAVKKLKDNADELLRSLNPKYGQAQQVSPAFQWAQNDTSIFLTIKYSVRWNAPGSVDLTDPSVNMSGNSFNFSGFGKHSNNKYRYYLSLNMFDNIAPAHSSWSAASVGKLSVTLRKRWARKWPRLLANKKTKVGNMHVWMEMQEKMDSVLGRLTATNSPVTCAMSDKMYCLGTDTCKKAANCSQCPGKPVPVEEENVCVGLPADKASVNFKDVDGDEGEVGGEVKISKAQNEFDIDSYTVYWGKDEQTKLELPSGEPALVGEAPAVGGDTDVKLPSNTPLPAGATHFLVFSKNEHGEHATPGNVAIRDTILPRHKPAGLSFDDDDGDKGEVGGTVTIRRAEDEAHIDEYGLYWGRSATKKIASASHIRDVKKTTGKDPTHTFSNQKIPEGAAYLLCFSKNPQGDNPSPVSLKIVDHVKPCIAQGDADCPVGLRTTDDADPAPGQVQITVTITPARNDADLHYVLYWGRQDCSAGGQSGAKNGHLKDIPQGSPLDVSIGAEFQMPEGTTYLLAFSKNRYGESDNCVATKLVDSREAKSEL